MGERGQDLQRDQAVTQVGQCEARGAQIRRRHIFSFRSGLRSDTGEDYMSVIAGEKTVEDAAPLVTNDEAGPADAVRYARAGDLQDAGFSVSDEPMDLVPGHVAVRWPEMTEWDEDVVQLFDSCFRTYVNGPRDV